MLIELWFQNKHFTKTLSCLLAALKRKEGGREREREGGLEREGGGEGQRQREGGKEGGEGRVSGREF